MPLAATPAGRLVVMLGGYGVADIGVLDPENPAAVQRLIETPSSQVTPTLSPDGNWIAYASNESGGRYEIYVQSFPSGGVKERVSRNGGANPLWGLEGSGELYFTGLNDSGSPAMMAARVDTEPQFRVLDVRELIPNRNYLGWSGQAGGLRPYDISPKDGRFFVIRTELQPGSLVMTLWVTLNWARGLKTLLHVP